IASVIKRDDKGNMPKTAVTKRADVGCLGSELPRGGVGYDRADDADDEVSTVVGPRFTKPPSTDDSPHSHDAAPILAGPSPPRNADSDGDTVITDAEDDIPDVSDTLCKSLPHPLYPPSSLHH